MELIVKRFDELTVNELDEIYKKRIAVFVVEQNCPYQEIDGWDKSAYHMYWKDEEGLQAYLRILPKNTLYTQPSLGRVISLKRRQGLATTLLQRAIEFAKTHLGAETLIVGAQTYARGLYEGVGFRQCSTEYLEDGIPHIRMELKT